MKKFLLLLYIITGVAGYSQNGVTTKKRMDVRKLIHDTSTVNKLEQIKDSAVNSIKATEENKIQKDISRNVDGLLQLQKEQKAKKKNAAMIRIGIGVALLVVFIIGLRRRKK